MIPTVLGPRTVHVDITNSCNARCITCWDHSSLLAEPRPAEWKSQRLDPSLFRHILDDMVGMGSVRSLILSGMGEPLTHPEVYAMLAETRRRGLPTTLISNLLAGDLERLVAQAPTRILAGIHGVTPETYAAAHVGWDEGHFLALCVRLRRLSRAGIPMRHVHVITLHNAHELPEMIRFGKLFQAERVNFKLASLGRGTEVVAVTPAQRETLLAETIPAARAQAAANGMDHNLRILERQVRAANARTGATAPDVACAMGSLYARIAVDGDVYFCCNTHIRVGSLRERPFPALWRDAAWQQLRDRVARGERFAGCETCGKLEQNLKHAAGA